MAGSNRLSDSGIQSGPPRDRDLLRFLRRLQLAPGGLGREGRAEPQAGVTAPGANAGEPSVLVHFRSRWRVRVTLLRPSWTRQACDASDVSIVTVPYNNLKKISSEC